MQLGLCYGLTQNTASEARGRYARICVQVDLNKPLTRQILLEGPIQEVQYEGLHTLCFSCERVGHRSEGCPYTIKASAQEKQATEDLGLWTEKIPQR